MRWFSVFRIPRQPLTGTLRNHTHEFEQYMKFINNLTLELNENNVKITTMYLYLNEFNTKVFESAALHTNAAFLIIIFRSDICLVLFVARRNISLLLFHSENTSLVKVDSFRRSRV